MKTFYDRKDLFGLQIKVKYSDVYHENEIQCDCLGGDLEHDIEGLDDDFAEWLFPERGPFEGFVFPPLKKESYLIIKEIEEEFDYDEAEEVVFNCLPIEWVDVEKKHLDLIGLIQVTWIKPDSQLELELKESATRL
jgi:hypothetical protein